jgi:gas vesicle protein
MKRTLFAALIGGALVYFFDPEHGQKRRDQAIDWVTGKLQQSPDQWQGIKQATANQLQGLSSNVSQRVSQLRANAGSGANSTPSSATSYTDQL